MTSRQHYLIVNQFTQSFCLTTLAKPTALLTNSDSAPSGGGEVVLHSTLCFPLLIYQPGLELWCARSEEF